MISLKLKPTFKTSSWWMICCPFCQMFCTNNSNSIIQLVLNKLLNFRTIMIPIEFLFCSVSFIIFACVCSSLKKRNLKILNLLTLTFNRSKIFNLPIPKEMNENIKIKTRPTCYEIIQVQYFSSEGFTGTSSTKDDE
jgi:ABC-type sugar transport system permease subunit